MQKALHVAIIAVIIVAIGFTALMLFLKYQVNGETNMPFVVSKISIISTANSEDIKDNKNTWNKAVGEDNDIYIYIDKNENYKKTDTIKEILIDNISIVKEPLKGQVYIYKPSNNKNAIFENKEEYKSNEIVFTGEQETEIKELKISNQGGIIAFRVSNQNIGKFISNEKEIKHEDLLNKINITEDEIKMKIYFNITMSLSSGKKFKSEVTLDLPVEDTIETGKSSKEITDYKFIFKRQ